MSTTSVKLRKPRNNTLSAVSSSSGGKFGRPRSWHEFNTRFQAVSVQIDLSPVPKLDDEIVKKRESNSYRKVRPLSQPLLDQTDPIPATFRPPSPKYTSFMAPNPWRTTKNTKKAPERKTPVCVKPNEQLSNYFVTTNNYDITKNASNEKINEDNALKARKAVESISNTGNRHTASISDAESNDSGFVFSGGSTPYATSSEKSPKWRKISRNSTEFEPYSDKIKTETEKFEQKEFDENRIEKVPSSLSISLSPPQIIVSGEKNKMDFFTEEETFHQTGNYTQRSIVPSPLKSCYAPVNTYDDVVVYSDSDNSSGDENSGSEYSRSNTSPRYEVAKQADEYNTKTTPTARPRQSSAKDQWDTINENDVMSNTYDLRSGTWPRRQTKKKEETFDPEELMKKFREMRDSHLTKFQNIYADSRKRIDDVMMSLKQTMTENGYREWYPRIR